MARFRDMVRPVADLAIAVLILAAAALPAQAGFEASVSGAAAVISPPASSVPGASLSNDYQIWDESSGVLSSSLTLDLAGQPGSYDGLTNYSTLGTTLAQGTQYDSTMVMLDPKTTFPAQSPIASITFNTKIIGLALFGNSLDASDVYGSPTTVYPHGLPNLFLETRGIDLTHNDRFSISSDGKTLTLQLTAGYQGFDQIRVFTAGGTSSAVPEPASWLIWSGFGIAFVASNWARRRRLFLRSRIGWTATG